MTNQAKRFALRYVPTGAICDVEGDVCYVTFATWEEGVAHIASDLSTWAKNYVVCELPANLRASVEVKAEPMPFKTAYALALQGFAQTEYFQARVHVMNANAEPSLYCAFEDRQSAIRAQEQAARTFSKLAGVRGLFD